MSFEPNPEKTDEDARARAIARLNALIVELESAPGSTPAPPESGTHARPQAPESAESLMDWLRADMSARSLGVPAIAHVDLAPLSPIEPAPAPRPLAVPNAAARDLRIRMPEHAPIERKEAYGVEELLRMHGEPFVRDAYGALLHREPDPGGLAHYREALRDGRLSRIEVLGELQASPEGRSLGVRVRGLPMLVAFRRLQRVPVLGAIAGFVRYLFHLPAFVHAMERAEAASHDERQELARRIEDLAASAHGALEDAQRQYAEATRQVAEALRQLQDREVAVGRFLAEAADRIAALRASELALRKWAGAFGEGLVESTRSAREVSSLAFVARQELLTLARSLLDLVSLAPLAQPAGPVSLPGLDEFYSRFEDLFRGTSEDIKSRLQVYVPLAAEADRIAGGAGVVDVGCGRGEWLQVLAENGIRQEGVDSSPEMVRRCRKLGLQVAEADGLAFLGSLEPASRSAVTAFHVIEHLQFGTIVQLFDLAMRALKPGGIVIFETPNPENLIVGACNFWYDPTHVQPLPPDLIRYTAEARGFERATIMRLHPFPEWAQIGKGPNEEVRTRLNGLLYGAQDYALVAYKPLPGAAAA